MESLFWTRPSRWGWPVAGLGCGFPPGGCGLQGKRWHPEPPERSVDSMWGSGSKWIESPSDGYWDFCVFPLGDTDGETITNWPLSAPRDFDYATVSAGCHAHDDKYLKPRFEYCMAFRGCIYAVALGTPEPTADVVHQTLTKMMPGSGYCCARPPPLQDNSPARTVWRSMQRPMASVDRANRESEAQKLALQRKLVADCGLVADRSPVPPLRWGRPGMAQAPRRPA